MKILRLVDFCRCEYYNILVLYCEEMKDFSALF